MSIGKKIASTDGGRLSFQINGDAKLKDIFTKGMMITGSIIIIILVLLISLPVAKHQLDIIFVFWNT